ncbi:MAG: hypothetical protein A2057_01095 [Ignavibacteria bacterium GWA2_35_9]|nr:MAG: hypothetical protein A2057_01095 [Ignavibacteria bacterium GWA2_35_9]
MKYKFLFLFILLSIFSQSFSQLRPESFSLRDKNYLSKNNSSSPLSNTITDIITIADTVWLGTSRGVSVSFDRGENWTNFYNTPDFGDAGISAVTYNKYDGSVWVAAAKDTEVTGGEILPKGEGFRYTYDGGLTWTSVQQPIDGPGDSTLSYGINNGVNLPLVRALPVTTGINNVTYDIAFTDGVIWIASYAGGLRKSTDKGVTWQRVLLPSDELDEISPDDTVKFALQPVEGDFGTDDHLNHRLFSIITVEDTIYAGSAGGINKSSDRGISWRKFNHINQENSISGDWVVALAYNQLNRKLWAGTRRAEGDTEFFGVSSTSDGGENWETFLDGERVWNFGIKNNDVIVATDNGAFRTGNQGNSWILPNNIIDKKSGVALTSSVFYSAASEGNDVWLGSGDGLAKLTETGFWRGEWKIYFASLPVGSVSDTYCYPNPFSLKLEDLKIKYSTGGVGKKITIRIFDFAMNIVKTVIQNAERTKSLDDAPEKWDGRDENGNVVPNGVYFYRIDFDSDNPVFGKIIVLQ